MTVLAADSPLLATPLLPILARLALPNMVAMLAAALVAIAETAYVGHLGTPALAGLALVFPMLMLQLMFSAGSMGGGVASATSRALGAGEEARAAALATHAVVIALIAGLGFAAVFLVFGEPIYRLLGGNGAALEAALVYSRIAFVGVPFLWLVGIISAILRGSGNMKVPSAVLLAISCAQIPLAGALGFGIGPVPDLGLAGIALGQVLANVGGAAYLWWYLASGRARLRLSFSVAFSRELFADILRVGALASISPLQTVLTVLVLTRLVSSFGTEALAGYGIGARLEFLLVPITFAIGVACLPMVGMAIGAGRIERARRVAWTAGLLAAALTGAIGVGLALFPDPWTRLFTSEPSVLAAARSYFVWAGPCYGLFGLGLCLYFASQGAGKVLGPVLAGTLRLVVVALGGWWAAAVGAPASGFFAVVGLGMVAYGLATAAAVHFSRWGPARP